MTPRVRGPKVDLDEIVCLGLVILWCIILYNAYTWT